MTATINDSSDEAEFEDDADDVGDEDAGTGGRRRRTSRGTVSYKETEDDEDGDDDDESDDDGDDIPLASLKIPSVTKTKKRTTHKAKEPAKKKAKATASGTKTTASNQNNNDYSSPSFALYGTESAKGKLIQNILCRWWYAIMWPDPSSILDEPPTDCDGMDGFPGVYICTEGEEVGTIKDFRDKENSPTFSNLVKKSSEELKALLTNALTEQKRQLIDSEGADTNTEKELNSLLKWVARVNIKKSV